ncbi:MAG: response regulator [Chitinispirillales bacterium]|jgi:signal transduction histidine kinase/CheY-like chemotaxis protein/PAS domain-containing protein|nr:response regulator [Chitinispirillales bacterium]
MPTNDGGENCCSPKRRDVIIDALNKSIEIFSAHEENSFDEVLTDGIRPVANAVGLDRVVFYALVERDGVKRLGQVYRWDKSKGGLMSLADELRVLPNVPVLEDWISTTSRGEAVRLRESDYSEDVAAVMRAYGIRSIMIVPIFTHGKFWGVVNLQDHTNDRYFDEGCADLLFSAARVFSNAVIRAESERDTHNALKALERREKMSDTLNKVSVMFLSQREDTFEETMTTGVREIADLFNLDRLSIWRNIKKPDAMHASQIYRWDRDAGGTTVPTPGLEDVAYTKLAPRWEAVFAKGETINCPIKHLPEAPMLRSFGVVSAFIAPIFINNELWGFALLEDRHTERFFEKDSAEMMLSAVLLCANTVMRADMEREIISANEFTSAIIDASPIGFNVFDENANITDCNDILLKILGTTKEYYLKHFYEFSPEYQSDGVKSKDKAITIVRRALNGEKVVLEWTNCTSTGKPIPFEITLVRVMYKGKYVVMSYKYDLRKTKAMSDSIREQGELLKIRLEQQELISELSRGFISSGDSEMLVREAIAKLGRYHDVSLVFVFSLDYERKDTGLAYHWCADEATPRMSISNLFVYLTSIFPEHLPDGDTLPIVVCNDTAVSHEPVFQALYAINVRAVIGAPLYVEGRLWGVVCVEQNFTPRNWTKREQEFVSVTASTIAGVIMRDIYTIKLKEALHKATEASKAKGEFLSNMSHEMRTPLNAITGMTAIGKSAKDMERKDYALGKIQDASTHLLGLINDILDMSKIEANMLRLSAVEFSFEKILKRVAELVNFKVDEKQQKFTVRIDNAIPDSLFGDDQRLVQVIINLLGNAVKFTPENGSISLETRFLGEENNICTIEISVSDTGIGISPEQQKHLFQSFQQADGSTVRKFGGTGLGLAISKNIVEMMGGKIRIESEIGKGSKFIFTICMKRGTAKKRSLAASGVDLNNIRILAVDDDPDILEYFDETARFFGVHCDTAASGEEALDLINLRGAYHICFVDWKMPGMDGIQLAHELKTRRASVNTFVIMISAAEWSTIEDDAKKAGVDKFMSKPLFQSTIADIIHEYLGDDKTRSETAQGEESHVPENTFAGRCVLLAEDVEINREIVLALLEPTELSIDCAESGAEAVRLFTQSPDKYDLIFMDVQMPGMDGYEATRLIRAMDFSRAKTVPIVAMTANVFQEDIEKCLNAGMNNHIGKPLDLDEVLDKLRKYLSSNH